MKHDLTSPSLGDDPYWQQVDLMDNWLNDKQYEALQHLYNEFNEAFASLPTYMQEAFYARLYHKD